MAAFIVPRRPRPGVYPPDPQPRPFNLGADVNIEQQRPVPGEEAPRRATEQNLADQRRNIRLLKPGVFLETKVPLRNHNSFWRAFAQGYYGDEDMWAWVKVETRRYFLSVLFGHPTHCRHDVYRQLDHVTSGVLRRSLTLDNTEMHREVIFILADLYDMQVIWAQGKEDNGKSIRDGRVRSGMFAEVRGNNNCRQIVLLSAEGRYRTPMQWSLLAPVDGEGSIFPSDHRVSEDWDEEWRRPLGLLRRPRALLPPPIRHPPPQAEVWRTYNAG